MTDTLIPGVSFHSFGEGKMGQLVQSHDWGKTSIGPQKSWSKSLHSYVQMILAMPVPAIIFWGKDQVQIYNDGYSQIMGPRRHPQHLGSTFRECWPEAYSTIDPWMKRVTEKGEVVIVEQSMIPLTRYGFLEESYFTFTFSHLRDDDGKIGGLLQIVTEVTDKILSERRLALLRSMSQSHDSQTCHFQHALSKLCSNPHDIRFAAVFLSEKLSYCCGIDEAHVDIPVFKRLIVQPTLIKDVQKISLHAPVGPWTEHTQEAISFPLRSNELEAPRGTVVFGISPRLKFEDKYKAFLSDVARELILSLETDEQEENRKKLTQERNAREFAEKALNLRDEFISIAAHELRTPLTALSLQFQLSLKLLPQDNSPKMQKYLQLVQNSKENLGRLMRLVEDLLDVTRVNLGKLIINKKECDVSEIIGRVAKNYEADLLKAKCPLHLELETGVRTHCDPDRIEQVVINLLTNAMKYGGCKPIKMSCQRKDLKVQIKVQDEGIGIAKQDLERIFNRFERASSINTFAGLGLGLFISKQIVVAHGGSIRVESELGKGSTFIVELP